MALFRTILYPTDLSPCAEAARPLALAVGRHADRLRILYVDTLRGGADAAEVRWRLAERGAALPVPVEIEIARDPAPAVAILHHAAADDVGLVVMGTHGRRGLSRLLLGSTAREVVQLSPCPVLTARHRPEEEPSPPLSGGPILAAIDFSPSSRAALHQAMRIAAALDVRLDLLHVVEELFRPVGYGYTLRSVDDVDLSLETRLGEALRTFRDEVADDFRNFGAMEILPGPPSRAIVEVAGRMGSSLVVLGTAGLRGLDHLLLGSTAEAVVRLAPCPVLTVRTTAATASAHAAIRSARWAPGGDVPLHIEPLPAF